MRKIEIPGVGIYKDSNGKDEFWRVRLGKRFTGGAVVKKTFASYQAAKEWVEEQNKPKEQHGATYFDLTPGQIAEARNAFVRLKALNAEPKPTLTEAVSFFIKHALPVGGMRTFAELAEEFLTARKAINCKSKTMTQYQSYFHVLREEFGELKLHELKRQDIEDWLAESEWSPRTRKNYLVTLTTFFNFAVEREYCAGNPAAGIPRPLLDDKPPGILTPNQAATLLEAALNEAPHLIPSIAIGLFAGLRRSEVCSLNWKEVDLHAGTIEVLASKAKTRQRRLMTIQPNLMEWLTPYAISEGPVAPDLDVFGESLRNLIRGKKGDGNTPDRPPIINEWPHNALRHSFGSYFFAKTKNENLTAAEMGNSPTMVFKHYRAIVKPEAVTAYWSIIPKKQNSVIPI
jgi:integrase